jgi:hypothetical protein
MAGYGSLLGVGPGMVDDGLSAGGPSCARLVHIMTWWMGLSCTRQRLIVVSSNTVTKRCWRG